MAIGLLAELGIGSHDDQGFVTPWWCKLECTSASTNATSFVIVKTLMTPHEPRSPLPVRRQLGVMMPPPIPGASNPESHSCGGGTAPPPAVQTSFSNSTGYLSRP